MSADNAVPQEAPQLPEKTRSNVPLIVGIAVVVALIAAIIFVVTNGGKNDTTFDNVNVKIGTTDHAYEYWDDLVALAAEEGITLEVVGFAEYPLPNPALAEGSIDINGFQHFQYLALHNNNTGDDLQVIGTSYIVPLPLYSTKYEDVSEFQPGDKVAIPNDATNQARALFVLESAGLISFTGAPDIATPEDIDTANSIIEVHPVEASQTAALINDPDIAGAVINNNFAKEAGLVEQGPIFADDPTAASEQAYINIFAVRADDLENEALKKIVELYHSEAILEQVVEASGGTATPVSGLTQDEINQILKNTEEALAASN